MDPKIRAVMAAINKKHGPETVIVGSEINHDLIPRMTSGSLGLDLILGGGWPSNQWNEIIANESMGKTVVALKTVAANQASDPNWTCVWIAAEEYQREWAATLGVDNDRVVVVEENEMEIAFQAVIDFAETKAVDCVVIDSLPMLEPSRERAGAMVDFQPGLGAFLTGKFFRMARQGMKRSLTEQERPILGIVINQWREKIGVLHGDPRTSPGGKAKNFAYFTRVELARDDWIEEGGVRVGQAIKMTTIKNKTYPPRKTAVVDFYFDDAPSVGMRKGEYDTLKETINLAVLFEVVPRRGAYYRYGDQQWQGRNALEEGLRAQPDLMAQIQRDVLARLKKTESKEPEPVVQPKKTRKVARRS